MNHADAIIHFPAKKNNSFLFKHKEKITFETDSDGTKNVAIMVPIINLGQFCRTLETPVINSEILFELGLQIVI